MKKALRIAVAVVLGSVSAVAVHAEQACRETASNKFDPGMSKACQKGCATKISYTEDMLVKQPGAKIGDLTRCPVSGVVFKVTGETSKVAFHGADYFVCCGGCAAKFKESPQEFVTSMCEETSALEPPRRVARKASEVDGNPAFQAKAVAM